MQQATNKTVDHFFRHEYGRIVSFLTQRFGADNFDEVEDAVQEALVKAMQVWPFKGQPDNPSAWILKVAQNKLLDHLRRSTTFNKKVDSILESVEKYEPMNNVSLDNELTDDFLKMMFACCHPALSSESQIILVLKVLTGFGKQEIAKALLKSEDAVAKAYTRAKARFKSFNSKLEVPQASNLESRLDIIIKIIYLIYNEGYNATSEDKLIKHDLCYEAMRLNKLLLDNEVFRNEKLYALMALMCFQASRFDSRISKKGRLLTLEEQDRSNWDRDLIAQGHYFLERATAGSKISEYQLQASIAACHSFAPTFDETNWEQILKLYDVLMKLKPDIIVQLNRVVALAKVEGPAAGLEALKKLPYDKLKYNYIFYAIYASMYHQLGQKDQAILNYKKALTLTMNRSEKSHLASKIETISS